MNTQITAIPASAGTRRAKWSMLLILLALIGFVYWAYVSKIEEITRTTGVVIASSRTQIIQSGIDGVIEEVVIREGEKVKKGQLLVRLERNQAEAAQKDSLGKVAALESALVRLHAEVLDAPLVFPDSVKDYPQFVVNQTELYRRRHKALQSEIGALESSLALLAQEVALSEPLLKTGDISHVEVIRLRRQVAELKGQISLRQNKFFHDAQAEMTKAEEELSTQRQILAERSIIVDRLNIHSPSDGLVKIIQLTTPGAKVRPGEVIMEILPTDSSLIVEGKLQPSDIAFIRPGMPAVIKLDAYDYSIYGVFNGEVVYVSPDAITEQAAHGPVLYYRVHIKINDSNLSRHDLNIEVQPGMSAGIDIRTGTRTVFNYIAKPIIKTFKEAMVER